MKTYYHDAAGEVVTINVPETDNDLREFMQWARTAALRGPIALDTETTGLDIYSRTFRLRTMQFGDERTAWVIHWERGGRFIEAALYVLRAAQHFLIHNAPFDWLVLDEHAPFALEILAPKTTDTKIKATLIDPREPHKGGIGTGLKPLSAYWTDPSAPDTQGDLTEVFNSLGFTKQTGWANIPLDHPTYNLYAGLDVIYTARLDPILTAELARLGVRPALVDYEHQIARMCSVMMRAGIVLDEEYASTLSTKLHEEESRYSVVAARYGVESVNSGAQVSEALLGMGEELTQRTDAGALKVDKAVLLPLADLDRDWQRIGARDPNPLADAVLRAKRAGKWVTAYADTFLNNLDVNGRVHPNINTLAARTGRMSVTKPALQTLPSSDYMIRRALLADPGHVMLSTDFAAVEMRVLAALANVKRMKQAINAGEDLHDFTARLVFGPNFTKAHRKLCKGIGFGKVYGGGAETIARQTGAPIAQVRAAIAAYDRAYPEIVRASKKWQREARATGLVTVSVTGRRLPLDRDRMYAVVNYQSQSAARDVLGQAMLNMEEAGLLDYMKLPIHDEVLASVPAREAQEFAREFERCMSFDLFGVPIESEAEVGGRSWGSLYMKDAKGKYLPDLLIAQDEWYAENPQAAYAKAA
ncbi:DNA polymerase I [Streptomyces phage Sebastisaurus]|uniref:DNA polymerase I n=1 Tax=Streptomyces phage Sebastisaurus TaxID=2510572 RepID=A0A411B3W5_9CAUD|nr:DNA polymerase I [Streptomyces phage Sebastisaurus]